MDSRDLFRRLAAGAKFDTKKFMKDAVKFNLGKVPKPASALKEDGKQDKNLVEETSSQTNENEENDNQHLEEADPRAEIKKLRKERKLQKQLNKTPKELAKLKKEQLISKRRSHQINVQGADIPTLCETFDEMAQRYGIKEQLITNIRSRGYEAPTPIQMQAIPLMLEKREILACAPTGSGKTAAFLVPLIQCLGGPQRKGFRAVIVSPTRELANQTYRECLKLTEGIRLRCHMIDNVNNAAQKFGPNSAQKFDILITTPNRLVFLLSQEPPSVSLKNVEWLIVDESDKLFEEGKQGFRDQLGTIYRACESNQIRRAFFSATFAHDVQQWCKVNLDNVVMLTIGQKNAACEKVDQKLVFVGSEHGKLVEFRNLVIEGLTPPVLVFVQTIERAKELYMELVYDGINVDVIHAERTQLQRDNVVKSFRSGQIWVLICTELMGRGIDFKGVNLVVNYDFPPSAVSYIHRIGRTGRAGQSGKAITFFTENDAEYLRKIAQVMRNAGCEVPDYMMQMKKTSKSELKRLERKIPERNSISTEPLTDKIRRERREKKAAAKLKKKLIKNGVPLKRNFKEIKQARKAKPAKTKQTNTKVEKQGPAKKKRKIAAESG